MHSVKKTNKTLADLLPLDIGTFKETTLFLNVYYKELSHLQINEKPALNGFDLLAKIGGYMGLFLGISLLTIFEIFELIFNLIISLKDGSVINLK
jgi:hypothetical protein